MSTVLTLLRTVVRFRVPVGWWIATASHGVKCDVGHNVGCKVYMCARGCEV